jgi:hypothetical protein
MSRAKKAIVKAFPPAANDAADRYNQAREAENKASDVLDAIDELRRKIEDFYSGFATHLEAHDQEPDVEEKCQFAELVLSLRELRSEVASCFVTKRATEIARAEGVTP